MTHKIHNTEWYRSHAEAVVKSDINTSLNSLNSAEAHSIKEAYKPQLEAISSSTIKEKNLLRLAIYANLIDSNNIGNVIVERDWILNNMKATQVLINTIQPNGLSYWVDQNWKVNKEGRGDFRTGEDGIYWKVTQNCLKELFWLHIPLSAKASATTVTPSLEPSDTEKPDESLALISSSLPEGVSKEQALKLAYEHIGKPLTEKKIQAYQVQHNISIDTENIRVWAETYGEMYAKVIEKKLRNDMADGFISKELQWEILTLFSYANLQWKNISQVLLPYIYLIQREAKDAFKKDRFNTIYGDFFEQVEWKVNTYSEDPEVQEKAVEVLSKPNKAGGSPLWDIPKLIEWDMTMNEYVDRNKWTGLLVGLIAFVLVWNKIPGLGDLPGMWSWFGRIIYLIGWAALWGKDLLDYGVNKIGEWISWANSYARSPEAQEHFENWKTLFTNWWNKLTSAETYNIEAEKAGEIFENTLWGMESANNAFKESDLWKYIEWFTGKSVIILWDNSFLNATKEQILWVESLNDLKWVMWESAFEEIKKLWMSDKEVKAFIQEHMAPQMKDIAEDEIVRKSIWYSFAISALEKITFHENKPLNNSPQIDMHLRWEFGNIVNGTWSDTLKQAGRKLAAAVQNNKVDTFNIDEDFASLSKTEKQVINTLLTKVRIIHQVQNDISKQIRAVESIEVKTQGLKDTKDTLNQDMQKLMELDDTFSIDPDLVEEIWLDVSDFNTSNLKQAVNAKRMEILRYAATLGMTEIAGIDDIQATLWEAEEAKKTLKLSNEVSELMSKVTDIPTVGSTPIEMREWYDINILGHITILKNKREEIKDSISPEFLAKIDAKIWLEKEFTDLYVEKREKKQKKLTKFVKKLSIIGSRPSASPDEFGQRKKEILDYVVEYNAFIKDIDSNTWIHIKNIWKDLFTWYETIVAGSESNAISDLDTKLSVTGLTEFWFISSLETLRSTVRNIEKNFDVEVGVEFIDISKPVTISNAVKKLQRLESITERGDFTFAHADILETKKQRIEAQVKKINEKFIKAINQASSSSEIGDILSRYNTYFSWKFSSFWEELKSTVGIDNDPVLEAYEKKLSDLQAKESVSKRQPILDKKIDDPSIQELTTMFVDFLKDNRSNTNIKTIEDALAKATSAPSIWDLVSVLEWEKDEDWVQDFLQEINKKIDSLI